MKTIKQSGRNGIRRSLRAARTLPVVLPLSGLLVSFAQPVQAQTINSPFAEQARSHFDIFAGNGKPGPYTLTWNTIRINSTNQDENPMVIMDGTTLKAEQYTLDAAKGLITFKEPLKATSVVRVSYTYNPKLAKRNSDPASTPVTVPLMRMSGANMQVTAVPNGGTSRDGKATGPAIPLVWGLGGKTNLLGGGLTSQFQYAGNDSSGMQLGYNMGNARNGIDLGFIKSDKEFATKYGKNFNMAEAARRRTLASRLTPAKWFGANFTSNQSDDLVGKGSKEQNNLGLRLGVAGVGPTLAFSRAEDNTMSAVRQETSVTTDKIDMAAKLTKSTSVTASDVRTMTDAPDKAADVKNRDLALTVTSTSVSATPPPGGPSQATLTLTRGTKEVPGSQEARQGLSLRIQPANVFIFAAEKRDQTVTPVAPDGKEGVPQTTSVQTATAELSPMPSTKFTTALSETDTNDIKVSATNFAASVSFGGVVNGAKTLEIATGVTNRSTEVVGQAARDTTLAKFSLRPAKTVTLTGGMTWNPENGGVVSQSQRQELGVNAKIGGLELGSGYSLTTLNGVPNADDRDPQFGQVSLTLGLQVNKCTKLNGTYIDSLNYRAAQALPVELVPRYTRTYGLGFTHTPGGDMSFTFGGTIVENRALVKPTDIKAEAKLGVRF